MAASFAKTGGLLILLFMFTVQPALAAPNPARKWLWLEVGAFTVAAAALGTALVSTDEEAQTVGGAVAAFSAGAGLGFHFTRLSVNRTSVAPVALAPRTPLLVLNWDF